MDLLLLQTAVALTGGGGRPWRRWAAAGLGGLAGVGACLPGLAWLGQLPGAVLPFLALAATAFGVRGRAWKSWLWFFCVCCAFAGLVLGVCGLAGVAAFPWGRRVYYRVTGRLLVLLAGAVYGLCRLCLDRVALHRGRELVRLGLTLGDRTVFCTALRDTGNTLRDPMTGEAVLVVRWQVGARLLPELGLGRGDLQDPGALVVRLGAARPELGLRLIPFRAVGTEGGLLAALCLDRVTWDGRPVPLRLAALSPTDLSDGGVYEALVGGDAG